MTFLSSHRALEGINSKLTAKSFFYFKKNPLSTGGFSFLRPIYRKQVNTNPGMTIDSEILQRFFSGNYSRKDYLVIKEYLDDPSKEHELRKAMQRHWMDLGKQTLPDLNIDHLLDRLQHRIRLEENNSAKRTGLWKMFQKVAAILILPLALTFVAYLVISQKQKHPAQPGQKLIVRRVFAPGSIFPTGPQDF